MPIIQTIRPSGFVLAGGRSSRMGTDKALLELDGEPLIARALRKLQAVCDPVAIAGGAPELARFAPIIPDATPGCGPLGGIIVALEHSQTEWNLFLPVDVPFIPIAALESLLSMAAGFPSIAVVAECQGRKHPLCAAYNQAALPVLRDELARDNRRVMAAITVAGAVSYVSFGHETWFRNLNTPEELALAAGSQE